MTMNSTGFFGSQAAAASCRLAMQPVAAATATAIPDSQALWLNSFV
jgi:hypothetical protein